LVWAVLDLLITHQTNGIHFNQLDRQRLKRTRYEGNQQPTAEEVTVPSHCLEFEGVRLSV
jgi:hypothetical protein